MDKAPFSELPDGSYFYIIGDNNMCIKIFGTQYYKNSLENQLEGPFKMADLNTIVLIDPEKYGGLNETCRDIFGADLRSVLDVADTATLDSMNVMFSKVLEK